MSWVSYINGPEVIPSLLPPYLNKIGQWRVGIETQTWNICPRKALSSIKPTLGKCYWGPGWDFQDMWDHAMETWRQKMLKKQQDVKKATKTSIKWVCGKRKKKEVDWRVSACARDFFSASNIGFKQEESALWLGWVCSIQDTLFIPKNQNLSLLAHSLSTFSLETSLSREEICYFGVFSFIFGFAALNCHVKVWRKCWSLFS